MPGCPPPSLLLRHKVEKTKDKGDTWTSLILLSWQQKEKIKPRSLHGKKAAHCILNKEKNCSTGRADSSLVNQRCSPQVGEKTRGQRRPLVINFIDLAVPKTIGLGLFICFPFSCKVGAEA
jgi:hypothetical protein